MFLMPTVIEKIKANYTKSEYKNLENKINVMVISHNDRGAPTFATARVCLCKRSDGRECAEGRASGLR